MADPAVDAVDAVDPITFEILRHKLEGFNDEATITIMRIAGSLIVSEQNDLNSAMMNAAGEVVVCGTVALVHGPALNGTVDYVLENYAENPGIGPGDMFLTNNPYVSGRHQSDAVVVMPVFYEGELVAWTGTVVHQSDVGGPVAGSYPASARSIFDEAIPMAVCRIVEGGTLRRDIEEEYLIRSRTRELNRLDLLGQIAANKQHAQRIVDLCDAYGVGRFRATLAGLLDGTERLFRDRLRSLPDGRWRHVGFIEHDGLEEHPYAIRLTMTKVGDQLDLDFTESSDQAPGVINAVLPMLRAFCDVSLMAHLAYDGIPWVPAAIERAVTWRTRKGSVVDAAWPAGVAMGGTSTGQEARTVVTACIARMLDASVEAAAKVMAPGMTSAAGQTVSGTTLDGRTFAGMAGITAGGGGARAFADGVDTAGAIHIPGSGLANVENMERNFPILYRWRGERPDSGGPGRYRGGIGAQHSYSPHGVDGRIESTLFSHSVQQSEAAGVVGGEPGLQHGYLLTRGTGAEEVPPPKCRIELAPGDVISSWSAGGGGYGDPLDRPASGVLADVRAQLVTPAGAARDYHVVVVEQDGQWTVDQRATDIARAAARRERLRGAEPSATPGPLGSDATTGRGWRRLGSNLGLAGDGPAGSYGCARCGSTLGPADRNVKEHLVCQESTVGERWAHPLRYQAADRFVVRKWFCPACASQLDVEVNLADAEPVGAVEVVG